MPPKKTQAEESDVLSRIEIKFSELNNTFKSEIRDLVKTVEYLSLKIDDYELKFKNMEKKITELEKINENNMSQKKDFFELQAKVEASEQYARVNNIEIIGIPEKNQENLMDVLKKIYTELKVEMPKHIEYASRVTPREKIEGRPRNVVVKLERRQHKDDIIAAIRKRKGLTAEDINMHGGHNIFINEHLSPKNKLLYKKVREFSKEQKYKFCWIKNCKIFLRLNENSNPVCINSFYELEKIKKRDSHVIDA